MSDDVCIVALDGMVLPLQHENQLPTKDTNEAKRQSRSERIALALARRAEKEALANARRAETKRKRREKDYAARCAKRQKMRTSPPQTTANRPPPAVDYAAHTFVGALISRRYK